MKTQPPKAGASKKARASTAAKVTLPERSQVADKYKWDPSVIFKNVKIWVEERDALVKDIPSLKQCQGKLARSVPQLKSCLEASYTMAKRIEYLDGYASRLADTDLRVSRHQAMTAAAEKIHTDYLAATAYMEPELLARPESKLRRFATDKRLKDYDRFFIELIRLKRHVLSKAEESILAKASVMAMAAYNIYKTFANADMEFPSFVDHKGQTVVLSAAMYARYRKSPHRADRKVVFEKFWKTYKKYRNSFSQMFGAQIKYYDFVARIRRYKDALEASLKPNAIPPVFYTNLIKSVTANLGAFHRYLKLRKKLLGIKGEQYYYDVYPLLTGKSAKKYTFEQSRRIIMQALRPLGEDYLRRLKAALADGSGWLDVFPNKGKRSGAYSSSVYGVHPLVLLNHTDDFDSLSTLAHELGHAVHSAYSNETQPYPKADYALFNAEVASIFNETLLIEYLLKKEKDPEQRKFLLSAYLDSFRGTVFRQTMFAEFELEAYKRLASRKALTADSLSRLYLKLLRKYHGHSKGVMTIQPLYGIEWAYIPHFYYNFYVYQYVSGFVAATALARRVLEKGEPAARQYIDKLLKAGSSKDPIDILKEAGVDMTTSRPFDEAAKLFADRVRELERLLRRSK